MILDNVKFFILDEADRMLDMGFGPEMKKIVQGYTLPSKENRQTLMFSATFPEEIQQLASEFLNDYVFLTVGRVGSTTSDIEQHILEISEYEKREKLCEILSKSSEFDEACVRAKTDILIVWAFTQLHWYYLHTYKVFVCTLTDYYSIFVNL